MKLISGHFLFTNLLLDLLKRSDHSRIVNVSSEAHLVGEINFDDINSVNNYNKWTAYSQSKLANILFTRQLAKRLKDTNVSVYCLHPGLIRSDLWRHLRGWKSLLINCLSKIFFIDTELGAKTTLYCSLDHSIRTESGFYYKFVS